MKLFIKRNAPKRYTTEYCNIRNAITKVMNHYFEYNEFPAPTVEFNEGTEDYMKLLTKEKDIGMIYLWVHQIVLKVYFNDNRALMNALLSDTELGNALSTIDYYVKETNGKVSYEVYANIKYGKAVE